MVESCGIHTVNLAVEKKYQAVRCEYRSVQRQEKRRHLKDTVRSMETRIQTGDTRQLYQEFKTVRQGYQPTTQLVNYDDGNLISDPTEITGV